MKPVLRVGLLRERYKILVDMEVFSDNGEMKTKFGKFVVQGKKAARYNQA